MTTLIEVNFDGLVGPCHHFGGLGVGNIASHKHAGAVSNPRAAALQGLDKMRLIAELADPQRMRQAILPPHYRPQLSWLQALGFSGSPAEVLARAAAEDPQALSAAWSASSMWTANAATVSPTVDATDGQLHLTVANLQANLHRSLEPGQTFADLQAIFAACPRTTVHPPLPASWGLRDEGAANHMRLWADDAPAIEVFVHEPTQFAETTVSTSSQKWFPARQSRLASRALARQHELIIDNTSYLQQSPIAISAGAFHNDVVATSYADVLFYHETAFVDSARAVQQLADQFTRSQHAELQTLLVPEAVVPLPDVVESYLFNCQIIPNQAGSLTVVVPIQCQSTSSVQHWLRSNVGAGKTFAEVHYVDLRESMSNGGGPACLRLRVWLDHEQLASLPTKCWWSEAIDEGLRQIIQQRYPTKLTLADLTDPELASEMHETVRQLRELLGWRVLSPVDP